MNLKSRFLLLASALIVASSLASWVVFERIAERIIERWGANIAEIQVRYDSARLLQNIEREVGLAQQMSDSDVIQRWARQPGNATLKAAAIEEMERFRHNFADHNYFLALKDSGAYFYNNAANGFAGKQLRYHLDPNKPADAWFYQLIEQRRDFHLNVNPDEALGVTKLWIDVLLKVDGRIVGVAGTGMDLEPFLQNIVDLEQPGINTLFVDYNGAIQLYRDRRYIDYASFVKPEGQKKTIELLLDRPADRSWIRQTLDRLREGPEQGYRVETGFVTVDGKSHLAGVTYLPSIGWYEITLLDLDVLLPLATFAPMLGVFSVALLLTLLVFNIAIRRQIIDPIISLEAAMERVRLGDLSPRKPSPRSDEMGRLEQHFDVMASSIREHTRQLEETVRERTDALNRLARKDHLTELLNRRGMNELLAEEFQRFRREHRTFGIVWLDIDNFKDINDTLGHAVGDGVLRQIAASLRTCIRPYDHAARWGGDEFLVLLAPCDGDHLQGIGERIRRTVESAVETPAITVSIGGALAVPDDTIENILQRADDALYQAKDNGRNQFYIAEGGQLTRIS
ncbi:sensor domain-containing diguanylate cyclase [Marinobacter halodurans]|uniref:diguanylate cyclase n=1 Tax=Marinobacter halodurans TaxID=2528979 RepID=A0ABY1ZPT4_9GAMM|nr:sensor domain-containing diguanylate cyclase [Marinobacter halodurans]TBW58862.1 sensor domain-containing diguanylate cyclase [Marinobacter halodurans]